MFNIAKFPSVYRHKVTKEENFKFKQTSFYSVFRAHYFNNYFNQFQFLYIIYIYLLYNVNLCYSNNKFVVVKQQTKNKDKICMLFPYCKAFIKLNYFVAFLIKFLAKIFKQVQQMCNYLL